MQIYFCIHYFAEIHFFSLVFSKLNIWPVWRGDEKYSMHSSDIKISCFDGRIQKWSGHTSLLRVLCSANIFQSSFVFLLCYIWAFWYLKLVWFFGGFHKTKQHPEMGREKMLPSIYINSPKQLKKIWEEKIPTLTTNWLGGRAFEHSKIF